MGEERIELWMRDEEGRYVFRRLCFNGRAVGVSVSSHDAPVSHNGVRRRTWDLLTDKDNHECHATAEVQSKNQCHQKNS